MPAINLKPRILTIDALRGFALFGIFFSHMIFWFAGGPLPQEYYRLHAGFASGAVTGIYFLFFNAKFFSVFAFLFGLSFFIQMQSLAGRSHHPALRFAWRLGILGVIGALHHVFWRADILLVYALLGLILIPGRYLSNRALMVLGLMCVFNIPGKCVELLSIIVLQKLPLIDPQFEQDSQAYLFAFTQANFHQMLLHNVHALPAKFAYLVNSGRLCMTVGFFLLGMLVGRLGWFEAIAEHRPQFIFWCKKGGWCVLVAVGLGALLGGAIFATGIQMEGAQTEGKHWVMWAGGFALLMNTSRGGAIFPPLVSFCQMALAPIGKMALTTYLLQSVIGVFLFFSIGAGLFSLTSPAQNCLLAVAVFGLLIIVCRVWLRYFCYGPVEWLWRCGSNFKWVPLIKPKSL